MAVQRFALQYFSKLISRDVKNCKTISNKNKLEWEKS